MPIPNFANAFGLEIRDTEIRVAQIQRHGKNLELSSYGYSQIPNGAMLQGEPQKTEQVKGAILNALKSPVGKNITSQYVACSIPERHNFTTVIHMQTKNEIQESEVEAAALQHIPYPIEDIQLDWTIIDKDPHGTHILVGAAPKNIIAAYAELLRSCELIPIALEPQSSAIGRSLLTNEGGEQPSLVVHLGRESVIAFIINKNVVYFSSSTQIFSGQSIQEMLSKKLDLSAEKSRKAAQLFGLQSKEGKGEVRRALLPELNSLYDHLRQIQEYASSHLPAPVRTVSKIILSGENGALPGLASSVQQEFRTPVELGIPGQVYPVSVPQKELTALDLQASATVLGLALHELT